MPLRLAPIQNCRSLLFAVLISLAALTGCARMPLVGAAAIPPIPAGKARLWIYRVYLPSETLNMTRVSMNGAYAGYAQLGGAFYRDVQPGVYHITVESYGRDFNQSTNVALVAGQEAFVEIEVVAQLGNHLRNRNWGRKGHVLCSADLPLDRARRDRSKHLLRRRLGGRYPRRPAWSHKLRPKSAGERLKWRSRRSARALADFRRIQGNHVCLSRRPLNRSMLIRFPVLEVVDE